MKKLSTIILTTATLVLAAMFTWHSESAKAQTADVGAENVSLHTESCNIGNVLPGCEKIIFSSERDNGTSDIVLMNPDGSGKVGLLPADFDGEYPLVNPAGNKIVFAKKIESFTYPYHLYTMNTDGSGLLQITGNQVHIEYPSRVRLSPDGSKVLFQQTRPNTEYYDIYIVNIDGTGLTNLTPQPDGHFDPIFNPDGSKIFYSQAFYFNGVYLSTDLFSMNIDGSNKNRLTFVVGESIYPNAFSPDGSKLALQVNFGSNYANYAIETINPDGSNRSRLFTSPEYTFNTSFSPDGSRILFRNGEFALNSEVYLMNADGTNLQNLTNHPQFDGVPSFNSDGSKIIFRSNRVPESQLFSMNADGSNNGSKPIGYDDRASQLFSMNADGSNVTNLSNQTNAFHTNGRYVFIDPDQDGIGEGCDNCRTVANADQQNTDGDSLGDACDLDDDNDGVADSSDNCPLNVNPSQLDTDGDNQGNACDADDDNDGVIDEGDNCPLAANQYRFAFSSAAFTPANPEIYTQNFDGTNRVRLTNQNQNDLSPSFNRAGTQIVWESNRFNSRYEIFRMNTNGSGTTRLTNVAGNNQGPAFSPDNSKIAFDSSRTGRRNIFIMNADGTNQTQLTFFTQPFNFATNPGFNHNGTRIAFESQRGNLSANSWDIYSINADGSNEIRLTTATGKDQYPSYSFDGGKIVFVSFRDGDSAGGEIYIMNADGSNQTRLTNNTSTDIEPTFTPDGSRIVYTSVVNASLMMMTMKTDGTDVRLIPGGGSHPSVVPQLDSDGDGTGDVCDASFDANTPAGENVAVQAPNGSVSFLNVSQAGSTSFAPIAPNQNDLPQGYTLCPNCPAYDITTTAAYTPPITVCLGVPAAVSQPLFLQMRLLHGENGVLVDRTTNRITDGNGQRSVCGVVSSLSPFVLASNVAATAANSSIAGRITDSNNSGIARITITVLDTFTGITRSTTTNSFGFYKVDELATTHFYVVTARSKKFTFAPESYYINLFDEQTETHFTVIGEGN